MGFTFTHIIIKLNTLVWHCSAKNDDGDDDDKTFFISSFAELNFT